MKNKSYKHTCITQAEVKAYMEDTFESEKAAQAFEDKLENCDHCLELLETMQMGLMAEKLLEKDTELKSKVIKSSTKRIRPLSTTYYWGIGIAASILLLIGVVWGLRTPQQPSTIHNKDEYPTPLSKNEKDTMINQQKSDLIIDTSKKNKKDTITKAPIKSPPKVIVKEPEVPLTPEKQMALKANRFKVGILESEINDYTTYMGENLEVIAPTTRTTVQDKEITFKIIYKRDSVLFVSVYDSTKIDSPVHEKMPFKGAKKSPQLFEKTIRNLPPATYYWRVYNTANQVLFLGKFRKTH